MKYAIETFSLTKVFPDFLNPFSFRKKGRKIILKDISIKICEQEIFGIIGPNGSGKTTLLKILATLIRPTGGSARVNGYDIIKDERHVRGSIGLVTSEVRSVYFRLTGRENLEFYAALHKLTGKKTKKEIDNLAQLLELGDFLDKKMMECSAGMIQRVCLARGLLNNPRVLLLDEPTKSLDIRTANSIRHFIKEELVRKKGITVLFSTHQPDEIKSFSDRIALMDKGEIKELKRSEEVDLPC